MSFPQLGYPQYLSAAGPGAYGGERPGVLAAAAAAAAAASSGRPGAAELGAGAGAAAVTSVLGMYAAAGPYAGAPNYSAFLPYAADLSLFSQMVSEPGLLGAPHAARVPRPGSRGSSGRGRRERAPDRPCRLCRGGGGRGRSKRPAGSGPATGPGKPGGGRLGLRRGSCWESAGRGSRPGARGRRWRSGPISPGAPGSVAAGRLGPVYPNAPSRPAGPAGATISAFGLSQGDSIFSLFGRALAVVSEPFKA